MLIMLRMTILNKLLVMEFVLKNKVRRRLIKPMTMIEIMTKLIVFVFDFNNFFSDRPDIE